MNKMELSGKVCTRSWWARVAVTLGIVGAATGVQATETPGEEFGRLCERLRVGDNRFFSQSFADELRSRLDQPQASLEDQIGLRGVFGRELLRLNQIEAAIAELERAHVEGQNGASQDEASQDEARQNPAGLNVELPEGLRASVQWTLALAYLQQAEDQNCVAHRTADSCTLPIRAAGVHQIPGPARRAGDLLLDYAGHHPRNLQAVWLLNLARRQSGDFPQGIPEPLRLPESAFLDAQAFPPWTDRGGELGINVDDLAGGAVMDDFDGDGFLDLVSSTWDPCGSLTAFRNDGTGGFLDVTAQWGLADQLGGLNLVQADYDGDGRIDLLVLRGAWLLGDGRIRNSLLRNTVTAGSGTRFVDVTRAAGVAEPAYPTQTAAWADYDGDGDLDLYVGNEATQGSPFPSQLFRNRGDGTFEDRAASAGVTNLRYTKGVAWGDYDDDGDPDLYVSNFGENRLYRNDGSAGFVDVAPELGVTEPRVESFATWFFDYDNDGDLDLYVGDYRSQAARVTASYFGIASPEGQPLLYRNDSIGTLGARGAGFTEVSRASGLTRPAMPMGANYGDLDNDGWLDFYLGTGEPDLASVMPNQMYRNVGGRFVEVSFAGRFAHLQKGHGVAFGDLDNDGDQDLFHQLGGFYPSDSFGNALFENPLLEAGGAAKPDGHWVTLLLEGRRANRFGVGARIEATIEAKGESKEASKGASKGERRTIYLLAGSGGSFGASSLQQEIGLGVADRIAELVVRWPGSGTVSRFAAVPADHFYRVLEGSDRLEEVSRRAIHLGGPAAVAPHH